MSQFDRLAQPLFQPALPCGMVRKRCCQDVNKLKLPPILIGQAVLQTDSGQVLPTSIASAGLGYA
ncbi:MAG: hypothetical protein ACOYNF_09535 [Rhodoferax sp.]